MSMLATTAPIWKLLMLFPEKAQPPHIPHATAHKLSNIGPMDICRQLKIFVNLFQSSSTQE
jgi:hypothetical protein